jgi:Flp pilus assembly protein protease CpaA
MLDHVVTLSTIALWALVGWCDWRTRRVPQPLLVLLVALSLLGRPWPWWALAALSMMWPVRQRRTAWCLAIPAVVVSQVTGQPALAPAVGLSAVAWSLGWWGGADSLCLLAIAFRYDTSGIIACSLALGAYSLAIMMARRYSLRVLVAAAQSVACGQAIEDIPAGGEMPAAAAMAAAGIVMEVIRIAAPIIRGGIR